MWRYTSAGDDGRTCHDHCDLPTPLNNACVIAESVLHPGDAFCVPDQPVDVLLLPIGGPWMKLSESIDYYAPSRRGWLFRFTRAAAPKLNLHCDLLRKLGPKGTELRVLNHGEPTTV
jgi:hypothetical protein